MGAGWGKDPFSTIALGEIKGSGILATKVQPWRMYE